MIVWINGAFGSGKTTLTEELQRRRGDAVVFDPEYIGFVLRESVPVPTGDFQDLPSWREVVAATIVSLRRHHADLLLIPMTLINPAYFTEIMSVIREADTEVLHVFLDVPPGELERRLMHRVQTPQDPESDTKARAFGISKIEECVAAKAHLPPDTLVLAGDRMSPAELADLILAELPAARRRRGNRLL